MHHFVGNSKSKLKVEKQTAYKLQINKTGDTISKHGGESPKKAGVLEEELQDQEQEIWEREGNIGVQEYSVPWYQCKICFRTTPDMKIH